MTDIPKSQCCIKPRDISWFEMREAINEYIRKGEREKKVDG